MSDFLFDNRLERAARRYANEAVRPIDAVEMAESAIRAARRENDSRRFELRWPRSMRFVVATAAVILTVVGASLLAGLGSRDKHEPSPSVPVSPSPTASPTPSPEPVTEAQQGTWLADKPDNLSFGTPSGPARMALTISSPGPTAAIDLGAGPLGLFRSTFQTFGVGETRFTTVDTVPAGAGHTAGDAVTVDGTALGGCRQGDEGDYQSALSPDGLVLTLTVVSETCPSRQAVLARSWSRSIGVPNGGGIGVVDGFDPLFTVVLPAGTYVVNRSIDSRSIRQDFPEFEFLSLKDPQGFNDPCDRSKGRYDIAPGADAVVAYFRQLRGFSVDSTTEVNVDGLRAIKLVLHANADASCPDGKLWEWQPKAETDAAWFLEPGVTDSLYIVGQPAGTVMFEVLPAPNSLEEQVIGTIHFLDRLPTKP